jgi:diguanylate cyclase (GGDEF)-like protein
MAGTDPKGVLSEMARAMFAPRDDPYDGADLQTSRRATGALLGFAALLSLVFLPLDPPTEAIGAAGWLVAGALIAGGLVGVYVLLRGEVSYDGQLAAAYLAAAGLALLVWLAGGVSADYEDLYLFALGAGLVHPPRRAFPLLGFVVACLALPLAYEGSDSTTAAKLAAEAALLAGVACVVATFLFQVRRQRRELARGVEVERRLARADPLTGLANRRAFDEALTVEIARAEREGVPMSVALVDLDGLKRVNDRYGHLEGDALLSTVARVIEREVRRNDRCFRWGGDEFAVLLPGTDRAEADYVLGRVAGQVSDECRDRENVPLEVSFGAAELEHGSSAEDLLALADLALMEHKTEKRRG